MPDEIGTSCPEGFLGEGGGGVTTFYTSVELLKCHRTYADIPHIARFISKIFTIQSDSNAAQLFEKI